MATEEKTGFLSWLVGLFMGAGDPEREKRRLLKQLGKDLTKLRFKFYRPKGEMALPQLAKFFYEIYRVTSSASELTMNADTSQVLKEITIDHHLTDEQKALRDSFTESAIREMAKSMDPKFLTSRLKEDMLTFISCFDSANVKRINQTYNAILRFIAFVRFDYYFTLKKFDSTLVEGDINATPKFEAINGEYVQDDLKDFLEVAIPIDTNAEWDRVFDILRTYKGVDVVNRAAWAKITQYLKNIVHSEILSMIVRHLAQDPYWKPKASAGGDRIVEGYLTKLKNQTEDIIQKIGSERRGAKIDRLVDLIFGGPVNPRTKYYTDRANQSFGKRIGSRYQYTLPLNYLKAFLLDFFKKDIRELEDILLVRGKWTTNVLSQQISDHYYRVIGITDTLISFDDSLADEGELGSKLKRMLGRVIDRDESTARPVRTMVDDINRRAQQIIADAANYLIAFGKGLKSLIEDSEKADHELIINWKELAGVSDVPLKDRMSEAYKKLYYFIQLLQMYAKGSGPEESAPAAEEEEPKINKAAAERAAEIDDEDLEV